MKNLWVWVVLVLALAAGVVVALWLGRAAPRPSFNNAGVVVLGEIPESGTMVCTAIYKTEFFAVSRARKPGAAFLFVNRCGQDRTVTFGNFRKATSKNACTEQGADYPFSPPFEVRAPRYRNTDFTLSWKAADRADYDGEWCYDVLVDGRRTDPRLRIDP